MVVPGIRSYLHPASTAHWTRHYLTPFPPSLVPHPQIVTRQYSNVGVAVMTKGEDREAIITSCICQISQKSELQVLDTPALHPKTSTPGIAQKVTYLLGCKTTQPGPCTCHGLQSTGCSEWRKMDHLQRSRATGLHI